MRKERKKRKVAIRPIVLHIVFLSYLYLGIDLCVSAWQGAHMFSLHFLRNLDSPFLFLGVVGVLIVFGILYSYRKEFARSFETGEMDEEEYRKVCKFHKRFSGGVTVFFLLMFLIPLVGQVVHMPQKGKFFGGYYLAYEVNEDGETCTITSSEMLPHVRNFSVPEEINGYRVTEIDRFAFSGCDNLKSVTFPNSVTTIGEYAFKECSKLESVTIPSSVTAIGDAAFIYCTKLEGFIVDENNTAYQSVDGNIYSKDGTVLVVYAAGKKEKQMIIPDFVTTIGNYSFFSCKKLTSVTIPDSVTIIGDSAFSRCKNLISVTIPASVIDIHKSAFEKCNSKLYTKHEGGEYVGSGENPYAVLIKVSSRKASTYTIHPQTKIVGGRAFARCEKITSVEIPNSVTTISEGAFEFCDTITDVYYTGSEAEWKKITIGSNNYPLTSATIHYNYIPKE